MPKTIRKHAALLAALVVISAVCFLFASRKEGMFIDEIYSYGLANSYYAPFVTDLKDGDMLDKLMSVPHVSTEEHLKVLMQWEEILKLATDAFASERRTFNINLLEMFEEVTRKMEKVELFWEIHNSLVALDEMLTFLDELRATRAGLCGVISRVAIPDVHAHIEKLKEHLEKTKCIGCSRNK